MYTIKTLNAISPVGLAKLPANQFEIDNEAAAPQGILVRSADMHDAPLPDSLLAIARAGAGTNNIPVEDCTNKGIVVFNTPGANANAVAELVVGALVAGSRNLVDAVNWAQTLKGRDTIAKDVEKGKKAFVGPELRGKTLGVIGLGAIGARVANAAVALGMEVLGYDPYISIDAAWSLSRSVQHCVTLGDMLPRCDYLTIHVPYLPTTRHTINAQTLAMCKDGVRVLNFARGELVDNAALLDALNSGKVAQYFCDFPTEELLGVKGVCCTPHLGASTPESETNCAVMAAAELSDYLKNGNIAHSVNLPDVSQPRVGGRRICIIHKNAPGAISAITSILTEAHLNIENMVNKGKKDVAYTLHRTQNITVDPDAMFDIQSKRLHEYKRQQLNLLYLIHQYHEIKAGHLPATPLVSIFGAKAAPAYTIAKDIIHALLTLSKVIAADPVVSKYLQVVFVENYNVTAAEKLIPACDLSEQISLASKEASGTGNMKFMLNGALTLGTMDGANVEICQQVGDENIYIFGQTSDQVIHRYEMGDYQASQWVEGDPNIRRAVDFLVGPEMLAAGHEENLRRLHDELVWKDWFQTLPDFNAYVVRKGQALSDYACDPLGWRKKCVINIAKAGLFSSDRTIAEYNKDIWHLGE